jgi:hypothetical protein
VATGATIRSQKCRLLSYVSRPSGALSLPADLPGMELRIAALVRAKVVRRGVPRSSYPPTRRVLCSWNVPIIR